MLNFGREQYTLISLDTMCSIPSRVECLRCSSPMHIFSIRKSIFSSLNPFMMTEVKPLQKFDFEWTAPSTEYSFITMPAEVCGRPSAHSKTLCITHPYMATQWVAHVLSAHCSYLQVKPATHISSAHSSHRKRANAFGEVFLQSVCRMKGNKSSKVILDVCLFTCEMQCTSLYRQGNIDLECANVVRPHWKWNTFSVHHPILLQSTEYIVNAI